MFNKEQLSIINYLIDEYDCSIWCECKGCPFHGLLGEFVCRLDEIRVETLKQTIDNSSSR